MRRLVRLAVLIALAVWAWRFFLGRNEPLERATVAYEDGSAVVVEPGSPGFERLAATARTALR
ncbi:MAG TPA: hypothetical protein VFK76_08225 [Gaiellaceae bacterium]|nr:hypothetical protein [Gaiellaceae bacterium]